MRRIKRTLKLLLGRKLREGVAELLGFSLLVLAAWLVNEIAGLVLAGAVLLNYAYGGAWRNK